MDTKLTVRLPPSTLAKLDALAAEQGTSRAGLARRLIHAALEGQAMPEVETPEEELLGLLSERARQGNVSAIKMLLDRVGSADPHQRAMMALQQMAEDGASDASRPRGLAFGNPNAPALPMRDFPGRRRPASA